MVETRVERQAGRNTDTWIRLMLVAFLANGLGPFGLKVLTEHGLAAYRSQYLLCWYMGGFVFALIALVVSRSGVNSREILLGAAMGGCSLAGQSFTALALSKGLPGHIAFPLTTGGRCSWWPSLASCYSKSGSVPTDCVELYSASPPW